jgi:predicted Zn-dependent peptidase
VTAEDASLTITARAPAPEAAAVLGMLARAVTEAVDADAVRAAEGLADQQRSRAASTPWTRSEQEVRRSLFGAGVGRSGPDSATPQARAENLSLRPDGSRLIVVGDVDPDHVARVATGCFARWLRAGAGTPAPARPPEAARTTGVLFVNRPGSQQATIAVGAAGPPAGDPRAVAFEVLNTVYGGYTSSRLFRSLVMDKGWSYGPLSVVRTVAGRTYFLARADTRNATVPETAREMLALLDALTREPAGDDELREAITYARGTWLVQGATAAARLTQLSNAARAGIDAAALDAYPSRLAAVDAVAVLQTARDTLRPEQRVIVVLGDHAQLGARLSFLGEMRVIDAERQP